MNKLVEIVGIPGTGKSYYLNKIGLPEVNYIEFGNEFKEWIQGNGLKYPLSPDMSKLYLKKCCVFNELSIFVDLNAFGQNSLKAFITSLRILFKGTFFEPFIILFSIFFFFLI